RIRTQRGPADSKTDRPVLCIFVVIFLAMSDYLLGTADRGSGASPPVPGGRRSSRRRVSTSRRRASSPRSNLSRRRSIGLGSGDRVPGKANGVVGAGGTGRGGNAWAVGGSGTMSAGGALAVRGSIGSGAVSAGSFT